MSAGAGGDVSLVFQLLGDTSDGVKALERAGDAADDTDTRMSRSSRSMAEGYDRVGEAAEHAEDKSEGFAYMLSGAAGIGVGFGQIMSGNVFEGVLTAAMGISDLAQGIGKFALPALRAMTLENIKGALMSARQTAAMVVQKGTTLAVAAATKVWTAGQWLLNAAMTANPLGLVILAIVALVAAIVIAYKKSETFRAIVQAAMRGVVLAFGWVKDGIVSLLGKFSDFASGVGDRLGRVVQWFKDLPGRIKGAVGDLGSLLAEQARRLIDGFIGGIQDKFESVKRMLGRLTSLLPDWKGPASVDEQILRPSGRMVIRGFGRGLEDEVPAVRARLGGVTAGLAGAVKGGSGTAAAAAELHVHVHAPGIITSDRQLQALIDKGRAAAAKAGVYVPVPAAAVGVPA